MHTHTLAHLSGVFKSSVHWAIRVGIRLRAMAASVDNYHDLSSTDDLYDAPVHMFTLVPTAVDIQ